MTKRKADTHAARDKRDQLLAEKFERENWSLAREERSAAHTLNHNTAMLLLTAAKHGGIEVGDIGGELGRLAAIGFVEIVDGTGPRRTARVTYAGSMALLCHLAARHHQQDARYDDCN